MFALIAQCFKYDFLIPDKMLVLVLKNPDQKLFFVVENMFDPDFFKLEPKCCQE